MRINHLFLFVLLNHHVVLVDSKTWKRSGTSIQTGTHHPENATQQLRTAAENCRLSWAAWLLTDFEYASSVEPADSAEIELDDARNVGHSGAEVSNRTSATSEIITRYWKPLITGSPAETSVDCDGYTRIAYRPKFTSWQASLEFPKGPEPAPPPSCTIHSDYCDAQWKSMAAIERSQYISQYGWDRHTSRFSGNWDLYRLPALRKRFLALPPFAFAAASYAVTHKPDFLGGCLMPLDYCFYDEQVWANDPNDPNFLIAGKITADTAIPCTIDAKNFALFYWPSTQGKTCIARGRDQQEATMHPTAQSQRVFKFDSLIMTLPKTEMMSGEEPENLITITGPFTLTSPSVYLAYDAISATDKCRYRGQGIYRSSVLAINPQEVSSLSVYFREKATRCFHNEVEYLGRHLDCDQVRASPPAHSIDLALSSLLNAVDMGRLATREDKLLANETELEAVFTTVPVDFAQLHSPLAADAYLAAQFVKCPFGCSSINFTILENEFFPTLVVPSLFRRLDPAWSSCIAHARVKDPPLAFPMAATIASASLNPAWRYIPTSSVASPGAVAEPPVRPTQRPKIPQLSLPAIDPPLSHGSEKDHPEPSLVLVVKTVTISTKPWQANWPKQGRTSRAATPTVPQNQVLVTIMGNLAIIGSSTLSAGGPALTTLGRVISILSNGISYDESFIPFLDPSVTAFAAGMSVYPNGSLLLGTDTALAGDSQHPIRGDTVLVLSGTATNRAGSEGSDSEFFHVAMPWRQHTVTGGQTVTNSVEFSTGALDGTAAAASRSKKNYGKRESGTFQWPHWLLITAIILKSLF